MTREDAVKAIAVARQRSNVSISPPPISPGPIKSIDMKWSRNSSSVYLRKPVAAANLEKDSPSLSSLLMHETSHVKAGSLSER